MFISSHVPLWPLTFPLSPVTSSVLSSFLILSFQGIFGCCTLGVSSGRGGERERHHLQCKSRNPRPGAAVGERTDGGTQPRLSARWGHTLKLRLHWHNASLLQRNKLSYDTPTLCDFIRRTLRSDRRWCWQKHADWGTHTELEPNWPLPLLCAPDQPGFSKIFSMIGGISWAHPTSHLVYTLCDLFDSTMNRWC